MSYPRLVLSLWMRFKPSFGQRSDWHELYPSQGFSLSNSRPPYADLLTVMASLICGIHVAKRIASPSTYMASHVQPLANLGDVLKYTTWGPSYRRTSRLKPQCLHGLFILWTKKIKRTKNKFQVFQPHHTQSHPTSPHHATPHHTTPHHTTPHHTTPHHTTPHHTTPHHTTPHHTTPHHTTPHGTARHDTAAKAQGRLKIVPQFVMASDDGPSTKVTCPLFYNQGCGL